MRTFNYETIPVHEETKRMLDTIFMQLKIQRKIKCYDDLIKLMIDKFEEV